MKTLQLIFKIYITISYFPVMLAAIQKKNEIASEINGKNRMVTASSNWLSQEEIHRYDITDVNYFNPIFYRVLLPQTLRQCFVFVTATGLGPTTTQFVNEHSTIWPNVQFIFSVLIVHRKKFYFVNKSHYCFLIFDPTFRIFSHLY